MQELEYPPPTTSRLRPQFVVIIAVLILIVALGFFNIFTSFHAGHFSGPRPLYPLEAKQVAAQLAAARSPAQPEYGWVESRDGDGALDVEDVNGPGTIYFDKQSHTRLLCIENNGCYHLRGHHEGSK